MLSTTARAMVSLLMGGSEQSTHLMRATLGRALPQVRDVLVAAPVVAAGGVLWGTGNILLGLGDILTGGPWLRRKIAQHVRSLV